MLSSCSKSLTTGTSIMGSSATASSQYLVTVYRGSSALTSTYNPGETLTVKFQGGSTSQWVIQVSGATFTGTTTGCSGTRVGNVNSVSVVMPNSGTVSVWAGWATGESTVRIAPTVTLQSSGITQSPAATKAPGSTGTPPSVQAPSVQAPSVQAPSSSSSAANAAVSPQTTNIVVGVVVGIGGVIFLAALLARHVQNVKNGQYQPLSIDTLISVPTTFTVLSAIVCIVLVGLWATDNNTSTQSNYLGSIDWNGNPLAYHIVFLGGGFFVSQLLATIVWANSSDRVTAKFWHVLIHTLGLGTLIIGMYEIVQYKNSLGTPSLATMHSWVGVMAISMYGSAYLWGAVMGALTAFAPDSALKAALDWLPVHRILGASSIGLSLAAVLTGIMDQLPQGSCNYTNYNNPFIDSNPAQNYGYLPDACKIAFGLGVAAVTGGIFTSVVVFNRHVYKAPISPPVMVAPTAPHSDHSPEFSSYSSVELQNYVP